jgi:hypothetical protein
VSDIDSISRNCQLCSWKRNQKLILSSKADSPEIFICSRKSRKRLSSSYCCVHDFGHFQLRYQRQHWSLSTRPVNKRVTSVPCMRCTIPNILSRATFCHCFHYSVESTAFIASSTPKMQDVSSSKMSGILILGKHNHHFVFLLANSIKSP